MEVRGGGGMKNLLHLEIFFIVLKEKSGTKKYLNLSVD